MNREEYRVKKSLNAGIIAILASAVVLLSLAAPSRAATYTVTSLADDGGAGELRAAITSANSVSGSTITFSVSGKITLTSAFPQITSSMTINGGSTITVDGAGKYQPFEINGSGATATMLDLSIVNGVSNGSQGGGILVQAGNLILTGCTLSGNTSSTGGGGILVQSSASTATLTDCTLTGNIAKGNGGGGIFSNGTTKLTNCNVSGNTTNGSFPNGGGIQNNGGTLGLTNCTLSGNTASLAGGGLFNLGGPATIINCTFSGNTAASAKGGGINNNNGYGHNNAAATFKNCILYGDTGGEIDLVAGTVTATYCDIQGSYTGTKNISGNPLLGTLASNGGPTQTMALGAGSPCYGAGTPTGAPTTDQRGVTRPNPPSIGAYDASAARSMYLLWNNSGQASLWKTPSLGSSTTASFGPYAGWTPAALTSDASGNAYLLWTTTTGAMSVWKLTSSLALSASQSFGPYTGWSAAALAAGPNGDIHILWNHPADNEFTLWNLAGIGGSYTATAYGPFAGWQAACLAVGSDDATRMILNHTSDNEISIWTISSGGSLSAQDFGPFGGWKAQCVAVGADDLTRILWSCPANNTSALWKVATSNSYSAQTFGPYTGWTPTGLAVNNDGDCELMWNNTSNELSLFDVPSTGAFTSSSFGPYSGWKAIAIAAGP